MDLNDIWMYFNAEIILLWLIIFIMIVYLFNTWFMYQNRDLLLLVSFALAIILVISNDPSIYIKEHSQHFVLNNYFIFGTNILLVKKFILVLMLAFIVMLSNYNKIQSFPLFEYLILIMIGLFSICIIIHGNHLFVIFIFIELLNLCIYCLLGINRDSNKGIESAFKYFIQSAFATIIGFFGISLIYFTTGTLFLNELSILIINKDLNWITVVGIFFIVITLFFKLGIFPLHSWVPEVYQGTMLISLVFIALFPKIAYIVLFYKFYLEFHSLIKIFCLLVSGISIIYGSIISLYQTSFRRLLAYGSMVHIGLIIYSISFFSLDNIVAAFFYLITYLILMLFIFLYMFFLYEKNSQGLVIIDDISQISMKISSNFILSMFFVFILFSLAGLPFFIGFIAKWYIFINLLNVYNIGTVIIFLCVSVVSASYYIRIIRFFFFFQKRDTKVYIYSNIKFDEMLFHVMILVFILNLLAIIFHNIIFLIILKSILLSFY